MFHRTDKPQRQIHKTQYSMHNKIYKQNNYLKSTPIQVTVSSKIVVRSDCKSLASSITYELGLHSLNEDGENLICLKIINYYYY